ncbi:uncharacterized protein LOC123723901 [Tachysurus ichikawai]
MWQNGPAFLQQPIEEWPHKSAKEVAAYAKEGLDKLQRKSFSAALTRAQAKRNKGDVFPEVGVQKKESQSVVQQNGQHNPDKLKTLIRRPLASSAVTKLIDIRKFSSLTKLIRVIALVWRAATRWKEMLIKNTASDKPKWEKILSANRGKQAVLTAGECEDALRDLFLAAQEGRTFQNTTLNRLSVYRDEETGLLVCRGRFQIFDEDKTAVPILPYEAWISTLLAQEAHSANHEEIAGTLLRMRKRAWVIKGRKLAKERVDNCVECRKARAKRCQQIMSDLPFERIIPARPFEYTTVDLFGPYEVKDEVRKKVKLKVWGIVFCCMASRAIYTDVAGDQSTKGFLLAYQRFRALRASKETVGKSELENEASKHGTEWSWKIHPANSPHRNGAAEATVHTVKRALHNVGGEGLLTWNEFQTFLYMAANLANERPIDARTQSREDCIEYISPNSLLLGGTRPRGDLGCFEFENYPYKRLRAIQTELNQFWMKWNQDVRRIIVLLPVEEMKEPDN